jgi:hypothetical protein
MPLHVWFLLTGAALADNRFSEHTGLNCFQGAGAGNIDSGPAHAFVTVPDCEALCDKTEGCYCVVMTANASNSKTGGCWRRTFCKPKECKEENAFNAFIKPGAPTPPPTPVTPGKFPYPDRTPLGPPCKDCPNIIFSITDDQDILLGGWQPMQQTQKLAADKGVTMTSWHIHTPICSPSRSELISSRYYHNIKSSVPVPVTDRILYAGSAHINGSLYKNESLGVYLRREKGYQVGIFGKANFNTYDGFDRW